MLVQQAESLGHFQGAFCDRSSCRASCCVCLLPWTSSRVLRLRLRCCGLLCPLALGKGASVTWRLCKQWFRCGRRGWKQGKSPQETHQFGLYLQGTWRQLLLTQTRLRSQLAARRLTWRAAAAPANTLGKPGASPCSDTCCQRGCCQQLTKPV